MTTDRNELTAMGTTANGTRERVRSFLLATFYVAEHAELKDDTALLENGIIDSTGVLEIIQFLEATFDLHVEDQEIVPDNLDSIDQLVAYVSRKVR